MKLAPSFLILCSSLPLSLSISFCYHCLTWKAGKVLGRRKREHHLKSLITALQSLIGKVRKMEKKQIEERTKTGVRKTDEGVRNHVLISPFSLIFPSWLIKRAPASVPLLHPWRGLYKYLSLAPGLVSETSTSFTLLRPTSPAPGCQS